MSEKSKISIKIEDYSITSLDVSQNNASNVVFSEKNANYKNENIKEFNISLRSYNKKRFTTKGFDYG